MEGVALRYLEARGCRLVTRRYRVARGEIDLICTDAAILVFVEVRYRTFRGISQGMWQSAASSITRSKQKSIIFASKVFLQQHRSWRLQRCRFDVVLLEGASQSPTISWIKNAFQV